ncbi:MAG TPA: Gfo/Idh/MocA family oxidoreductase [Planctomycetota bacterium]|nr:Gfo/Idh/MocA family oxidoreductase [Planctomycetota bacterium]
MNEGMPRRQVLAATLAAPYFLTSGALGAEGKAPASDRIAVGHIGVGGRGGGLLGYIVNTPVATPVAVCDIDQARCDNAYSRTGGTAKKFHDFRDLLDQKDIDAVVIASPDHWHPLHTIHACRAGKDVYCEKPLSVTIREGQAVVAAARRYDRVVQLGTQWRSMAGRYVAQYIRNGYCGTVREVRCWHYPNPTHPPAPPPPVPKGLDYDAWLGPLPWMPYHPARTHGNFRWLMCSGGGNIRDRGAHIFGIVSWAMNVDHTGPVSIEATGDRPDGLFDNPVRMSVTYEFKNPDWTLHWDQPGEPKGGQYGAFYVGDKDTLSSWDNFDTEPKAKFEAKPGEIALYRSTDHMGNFLECVRTRRRPIMDVAIGHRATSLCNLGNVAYLLGRKLAWDPVKEEFVADDEANRMLHYPYREPWRLS